MIDTQYRDELTDAQMHDENEHLQQTPPPKSHMNQEREDQFYHSGAMVGRFGTPSRNHMPYANQGYSDNELQDSYTWHNPDIVYSQQRGPHPQIRNIFITKKIKPHKSKGLEPLTASPYASLKRNGARQIFLIEKIPKQ